MLSQNVTTLFFIRDAAHEVATEIVILVQDQQKIIIY